MKQKHFDGRIGDSSTSVRIVGFVPNQQQVLSLHQANAEVVSLEGCEVKKALYTSDMEILVTKETEVLKSPRKIKNPVVVTSDKSLASEIPKKITLDQLTTIDKFTRVCMTAKVMKIYDEVEVKAGLVKQDVTLSDKTDTARLTLWAKDIGKVELNKTYDIQNLSVQEFAGNKYLVTTRFGSTFESCSDMDDAVNLNLETGDSHHLANAEVAAVSQMEITQICFNCNSNVKIIDDHIGSCTKCSSTQQLYGRVCVLRTLVTLYYGFSLYPQLT